MADRKRPKTWSELDAEEKELWAPMKVGANGGLLGMLFALAIGSLATALFDEPIGAIISICAVITVPFYFMDKARERYYWKKVREDRDGAISG